MRLSRTHLGGVAEAPPRNKTIHIFENGSVQPDKIKYKGKGDTIFVETDAPVLVTFDNQAVLGTAQEYLRPEDNPIEFTTETEMQSTTYRVFVAAATTKGDPPRIDPGGG